MNWRFILALVLILLLVGGGICLLHHNRKVCTGLLHQVEDLLADGDSAPSAERLSRIREEWDHCIPMLSLYTVHNHLHDVSAAFARAESFLQTGNHDEYRAALQELTVMLRILQNIDRPLLQNIL